MLSFIILHALFFALSSYSFISNFSIFGHTIIKIFQYHFRHEISKSIQLNFSGIFFSINLPYILFIIFHSWSPLSLLKHYFRYSLVIHKAPETNQPQVLILYFFFVVFLVSFFTSSL